MRTIRRLALIAMLASAGYASRGNAQRPPAPGDSAKVATIRRLLGLMHTPELMAHAIEGAIPAQRAANPQIPAAFWDVLQRDVDAHLPELVDSLVPLYAGHFSQQELDDMVRFYLTPTGRHIAELQPTMLTESMDVGRRWGIALGRAIGDSLTRAAGPAHK